MVDVSALDAEWWSVAVFDDRGGLIRNSANRFAFNSSTVLRDSDGGARIVVSREARPGNWLPTASLSAARSWPVTVRRSKS